MPEISRFFGIVIFMRFRDHAAPHIHIRYGDYKASVDILTLDLTGGRLSPRALAMVREWILLHRRELLSNWERARKLLPLRTIKPLS